MVLEEREILIIDEDGFSRICSALLGYQGYRTKSIRDINDISFSFDDKSIGLIVTSYPYSASILDKIKGKGIPTIVLSDQINRELLDVLDGGEHFYCMIKPLDYKKFCSLVKQLLNGEPTIQGGYNVI
ncbi:MAG: DNA-binding response regulator [Nitrospirae bacterium]|nr:MAG: DNA-binding response regulator [Nitrospirota bacterium]